MNIRFKKLTLISALLASLPICGPAVYAAKPVNLRHAHPSILSSFYSPSITLHEIGRHVDFKKTLHVRVQEMYLNHPVWGADAVLHLANGKTAQSMNGILYQDLEKDLAKAPSLVFTQEQAQKALQARIEAYQHRTGGKTILSEQASQLIVFIDKQNTAHWAYKVSFRSEANKSSEKPVKLVSIVDAVSLKVYVKWDDIKTIDDSAEIAGGGFGGNIKMGKLVYDGLQAHLAKLSIKRDDKTKTCSLQNDDVNVKNINTGKVMTFPCAKVDGDHNNVYWDGDFDAVNDGYSPGNDALFGGQVIKHMYNDWYGIPVLVNADGTPMKLRMVVHQLHYDNAYWDGRQMTFGDGETYFYPLTSLGVAAHEISHGFTEQHSNLAYYGQSGGMNEAFSDMAAQAAEVYAYGSGKNSWQIGPEIFKEKDRALRYMDLPSRDCGNGSLRQCSIDDATQYDDYLDVHYSSGVYNRFFYTLGTTDGWDAKKAFDVMVHANSSYWTSTSTFVEAACGTIKAAHDLNYDTDAVKAAFDVVKVDYSDCK